VVKMRKTKIIATLGPPSWNSDIIRKLVKAGTDAFRINFSHGDESVWKRILENIASSASTEFIPLIGDLQGPVIRTGDVEPFEVKKGDKVTFEFSEQSRGEKVIPLNEPAVFSSIEENDVLLIESGRLAFRVERIEDNTIHTIALIDGIVQSRKTFAIKGKDVPLPSLTPRDIEAVKFAVKNGFDYIALSFVRTERDVEKLRQLLSEMGSPETKIIAKIETRSAVNNLKGILEEADAALVARGDLAIYYDLEEVPEIQYQIIKQARAAGKPSIVATQLLDSMVEAPVPTRSEVVDIFIAIKEGADALLLTSETAAGKYPVESVLWLARIAEKAEKQEAEKVEPTISNLYYAVAKAAVSISNLLSASIIAYSKGGNTARRLSSFRPKNPLYVFSSNKRTVRQVRLFWGVTPIYTTIEKKDPNLFSRLIEEARTKGLLSYGDIAVITVGVREGATDLIRVERITQQ